MEEKITFSPALFSSQVNTALLRLGLSKLHNDISSSPLEQLLGAITGHSGTFCLIIRAVRGFRLVGLAIKNHHSKFPFPSAAPPPLCSSRQASLLLLHCPFLDFVLKPSQPPIHLWSFIWPLCIFQHNPTDSEPQFSFFFVFHVTVNFGALINPLTLVFTPFQHQQGIPMVCGRHPLTGLYSSLHIFFLLHKSFSQVSASIFFSLF